MNYFRHISILLILQLIHFYLITDSFAQVTQEWVASYNGIGSGYNFPKKSAIDKDGNFIVAGNSDSTNGYDYIVLKYSPSGNLIWKQRYNGTGNGYDYLMGMVLDNSGNVYVTGESDEGILLGGINWVTIKYGTYGQKLWKRSLNWTANNTDEPFGMNIDSERNIYVVGFGKTSTAYRQMVTIKYSSTGDSLWTKVYRTSPTTHDWGYSVVVDDSLNVYSSGYGIIPTGNELVTIKYDRNGNEKWIRKFPTYYGDYLRPALSEVDSFNNIVVVGYQYTQVSDYDFVTLKYSPEGDLLWNRLYDGGDDDYSYSLFLDNKSNILLCGSSVDSTLKDFLILKYSSYGDILFSKTIDGESSATDEAIAIVSDTLNNAYVTGFTQSLSNNFDFMTVKLNFKGEFVWSRYYHTAYDNYARCVRLDKNGSVFVSGSGGIPGGNSGIVSIKYSQVTSLVINNMNIVNYFQISNYPNPFNSNTELIFNIPFESHLQITIFNIFGKEIETLINEYKNEGEYKVTFSGERYPSGVYFYSLISNGVIVKTNKMLLIK